MLAGLGLTIFRILGPVEVWSDERQLALGGPRQLALLAFLVLHANRAVSSDALIDAVWGPGRAGASKRLQVAIARLRKALEPLNGPGEPALRTVGGGYLLALAPDQVDAEVFGARVREGRDALGQGEPARAVALLEQAVELWRGPPLAEVAFEDFAQPQIRRLQELHMVALEARIDAELRLGRDVELLGELEALLSQHPTRESLAGQLMIALYRGGRQADALEVYSRTRARLADELGLEPGPGLQALQAEVLTQALPMMARASQPQLPAGMVTMMFTDIVGSTALIRRLGDEFEGVLERHSELLRLAIEGHGGIVVERRGDGLFAAFTSARAALLAANDAQASFGVERWPGGVDVRIRIGVHSGEPRIRQRSYWGEDVHYAARLAGVASGGQVLVTETTVLLAGDNGLVDLGRHRLKDFPVARRIYQLGAHTFSPLRTLDPLHSNLPSIPGTLIGRDREHQELVGLLSDSQTRLVTITGAGGAGKTRLALAVAETMAGRLRDGAFFVGLAEVTAGDIVGAISAPLGVRPAPGQSGQEALVAALVGRELLLVLDNFEHLLDAASLIALLLERTHGLRALVTSQAPLRVRGEHVISLAPLAVPQGNGIEDVLASPAGRMLIECARAAAFELTPAEAAPVAGICRTLAGLPLAMELAAARLTVLSPRVLLERLESGIDALGQGPRDLPPRQRGLRAALDWTVGLLAGEERTLLRRLAVFAGPAPIDRIEQVCGDGIGDVLEAAATLIDLCLLAQTPDARFRLHESVRQYAREQLVAAGELQLAQQRRAEALASAACRWGRRYLLEREAVQAEVARNDRDLIDALAWAAEHDADSFACMAGGAGMALLYTARLPSLAGTIEQSLADRRGLGGEPAAWLSVAAGLVAFQRDELDTAHARIADAIAATAGGDDTRLEWTLRAIGVVIRVLTGDPAAGVRIEYTTLCQRAEALDDRAARQATRGLEPYLVAYCERRPQEATAALKALMEDRSRTDWAAVGAVYCWPDGLMAAGEPGRALRGYREALRAARDRLEPPNIALQLEGYVMAFSGLGRHTEASEAAGWADSVRQTAGVAVSAEWKAAVADALRVSRDALGAEPAEAAYRRGRALSLESAVAAGLDIAL